MLLIVLKALMSAHMQQRPDAADGYQQASRSLPAARLMNIMEKPATSLLMGSRSSVTIHLGPKIGAEVQRQHWHCRNLAGARVSKPYL